MSALSVHYSSIIDKDAKYIFLSVNESDVLNHLKFLKKIDDDGHNKYYQERFVHNAIRRYEKFWIPFVLQYSNNHKDDLLYQPPLGNNKASIIYIFSSNS